MYCMYSAASLSVSLLHCQSTYVPSFHAFPPSLLSPDWQWGVSIFTSGVCVSVLLLFSSGHVQWLYRHLSVSNHVSGRHRGGPTNLNATVHKKRKEKEKLFYRTTCCFARPVISICSVQQQKKTTTTTHSFTGNQSCVKHETTLNFSHFFGNLTPVLHILSHPRVSDVSGPTHRAPAHAWAVQRANNSVQDVKSLAVVGWDAPCLQKWTGARRGSPDESLHKPLHPDKYFLFYANVKTNTRKTLNKLKGWIKINWTEFFFHPQQEIICSQSATRWPWVN